MAEKVGVLGKNAVGGGLSEFGVDNACLLPIPGTLIGATTSLGRGPYSPPSFKFP